MVRDPLSRVLSTESQAGRVRKLCSRLLPRKFVNPTLFGWLCWNNSVVKVIFAVRLARQEFTRRKPKGDGGKGTGKKMSRQFATNVTTIYDILQQLATFYDNFRLFIPLT